MLHQSVGPFFIMVSEMIRRDFVRFMVIPAVVLPAFAVAFCVLFNNLGAGEPDSNAAVAADANRNFGQSAFTLVLLGVGLGDEMGETMAAEADGRVIVLLLLYILIIPIMAMNLLVAMMADTCEPDTFRPAVSTQTNLRSGQRTHLHFPVQTWTFGRPLSTAGRSSRRSSRSRASASPSSSACPRTSLGSTVGTSSKVNTKTSLRWTRRTIRRRIFECTRSTRRGVRGGWRRSLSRALTASTSWWRRSWSGWRSSSSRARRDWSGSWTR